jgi:hypothetical protein
MSVATVNLVLAGRGMQDRNQTEQSVLDRTGRAYEHKVCYLQSKVLRPSPVRNKIEGVCVHQSHNC